MRSPLARTVPRRGNDRRHGSCHCRSVFVRDRLDTDDSGFDELVEAIRERGQDTPVLVRPHPKVAGRYMVVFGHRRVRAARALGRKVRAVVKDSKDREHVVAQGQENSARQNLSFIERARFARKLDQSSFRRGRLHGPGALTVDRATLSKMLSVAAIPTKCSMRSEPREQLGETVGMSSSFCSTIRRSWHLRSALYGGPTASGQ